MKTNNVTFLGPVGATFSHDAYDRLARLYDAPAATETNCVPAQTNSEVLKLIAQHGGYGAIAIETRAEGRVAEPVESFIELLKSYDQNSCPFQVIGALNMKLHFCLMARPGVAVGDIDRVIAHPKGLGACAGNIAKHGFSTMNGSSNGEAARMVAEDDACARSAALGPASAAKKYRLNILDEEFEDKEAVTTFLLVGPKEHPVVTGENNRMLIVFEAAHKPGSLVQALLPFSDANLNLVQVHSVHVGDRVYAFAIELEMKREELPALEAALARFDAAVATSVKFGPFEVR
jgi:prephenate dehydratase